MSNDRWSRLELIITEKDNAARRIAEILSGGSADSERRNGVNVYRWGGRRVIGLSGHVVGVDFPPEYSDWRDVRPVELVDAEVVKTPTQENIVSALRSLAREADSAVIATDYDREGELIGKEAYEIVREETEAPIRRVRFSSITDREVTEAFENPDELDFDLAAAGEARQIIDLMWGASLTRFLSLSAKQLGNDFISVGRVQSPTLKLIVDREREIEAFVPEDYWELYATLAQGDDPDGAFEAQYFLLDEDDNEQDRVWDEEAAEAAHERLLAASDATVSRVSRRTRTDQPPAPFNTTQYIRAAGSIGFSAQRAMSIAEELYTAGFITYPRTDNTVYPEDLEERELLETFAAHPNFGDDAEVVLEQDEIAPTSGENETTDHPPIHPTGEFPSNLSGDEWKVYELVVRRFYATCSPAATWAHLKVVAEANDCKLKANGKRLVEPGYHAVYPYFSTAENYVPEVDEGDVLDVSDVHLDAKQTQPPRRYGQSRLIETMEKMGIGTKCLSGDTNVLARTADGDVARRPVEEIFEHERILLGDGDVDVATTADGPRTLSFDETQHRVTELSSELISRRPIESDESMLQFDTLTGTFSVTDDHPLYVKRDGSIVVQPATAIGRGDRLLSTRYSPAVRGGDHVMGDECELPQLLTWDEFAAECDWSTKLYGTDCNEALAERRRSTGETQREMADRLGTDRTYLSAYENEQRDVPVWILGELGIRPGRIHGLNQDTLVRNPFPLYWSPAVARLVGNLLGDGSVHVNEGENVVDVRYHNTDPFLVERFRDDVETVFGYRPTISERPGSESHHLTKYQVNVAAAVGRMLYRILQEVTIDGCPEVPRQFTPAFIGALFDDEGHISRDRKAFISNTDHDLLAGIREMLDELDIESKLSTNQHKLYIRGRKNLEPFLDSIPIANGEKFYRGLDALREYDVTLRRARILELADERPCTSAELAEYLGRSQGRTTTLIRSLRESGYLEKRIEGSNRSHEGNRTIRYEATGFRDSVYASVLGYPSWTTVLSVSERTYDGPVYDLSVSENAPNFAVEGGIVVHNSTRHNTLEKLYDRGYIENDPPRPTRLAMGVVEAAEQFADHIVDEQMTAQLERDMTAIAEGEATLDDVTQESRDLLKQVFSELHESREEIGEHLRESLKADKIVGECPLCGEDLLVRRSRRGSYFVGCDGFPDCRYTLPLPNKGEPAILDETCEEHGLSHVKMLAGRGTFVHGCPRCEALEAQMTADELIGICPECGEAHGGELAIKTLQSGSRLVGCTRYPECEYSLPLPRRGDIVVTDEECDEHGLPFLEVHDGEDDDDPWELGCPICNYEEYRARNEVRDIEDLDGVGAKTAERLQEAGIASLDDLRDAEPDDVASRVQGVSADRIREWQTQAGAGA